MRERGRFPFTIAGAWKLNGLYANAFYDRLLSEQARYDAYERRATIEDTLAIGAAQGQIPWAKPGVRLSLGLARADKSTIQKSGRRQSVPGRRGTSVPGTCRWTHESRWCRQG